MRSGIHAIIAIAMMTGLAIPATAKEPKLSKQEKATLKAQQQFAATTDQLIQTAHDQGMSIVVTTTLNLDFKYPDKQSLDDNNALLTTSKTGNFITDLTSAATWKNMAMVTLKRDDPGGLFKVGNKTNYADIGPAGAYYRFAVGPTVYMVYILMSGHYDLYGNSFEMPRSLAPEAVGGQGAGNPSRIGQAVFTETKFPEYIKGREWRDTRYGTDYSTSSYCSSVYVQSGQCASWGNVTNAQTVVREAAGYYETTQETKIDGLLVNMELNTPFANFDVKKGEVLLTDGLFAENPAVGFNAKACERVGSDRVNCALTSYHLTRIPAYIGDLQKSDALARGYPKLAQILAQAQYRPLTFNAKPDAKKLNGRDVFYVKAGK